MQALFIAWYNFGCKHGALKGNTPAMTSTLTDHVDDRRIDREGGSVKLRKLRIAWSGGCGIVCVLLIALWVRSYATCDIYTTADWRTGGAKGAVSVDGQLYLFLQKSPRPRKWRQMSLPAGEVSFVNRVFMSHEIGFRVSTGGIFIVATHWLAVAMVSALAAICWVPWSLKFNLRTMLIGTSLLAVLLGAAIHSIK